MVGYCMKDNEKPQCYFRFVLFMKDNEEEHFEFVHHNVSAVDMNEGKMEHAKFRKVGFNNHASISNSNILQRVRQWGRFHMKKQLDVSLLMTFSHMCKNKQFYPKPTWVIPVR